MVVKGAWSWPWEWTGCFLWIIPGIHCHRQKGAAWEGESGKCPRFFCWNVLERQKNSPLKRCKSLGFLQRQLWHLCRVMTHFEKHNFPNLFLLWLKNRSPWKITHSYGIYQEKLWFATAMLVYSLQDTLTALSSCASAEPRVWQDLEKASKNRSSGGRVHRSRRKQKHRFIEDANEKGHQNPLFEIF